MKSGNFGKKKWPKAEIKGAIFQYFKSTRDDVVRQKNGKLKEHGFLVRRRLRAKRKLTYRTEVLGKAHLSADDKTKIKALLDLPNAVKFMSSEESDNNEDGRRGPPPRHIKPLRWERSRLKKIKAVLDASYEAHMTKRQK
ncbi:uncharacterized protein [Porites lutea]|uniref:uncharacterized protein n=1 Tax=Porites lutea TaxID=51062 RepID=UPI003CC558B8